MERITLWPCLDVIIAGNNVDIKRMSFESGDSVGVCVYCRPLFGIQSMSKAAYESPRRIMLEHLQQFIRKPEQDEVRVEYFKPSGPLAPYLR
jgi:hypothetical protein